MSRRLGLTTIIRRWILFTSESSNRLKLQQGVLATRRFSSPRPPPASPGSDNPTEHSRFFGTLAALFVLGAAVRVVPLAASNTVEHCIKLMDTDQPFFIETGLARLEYLFVLEAAKRKAVLDLNIIEKLVDLVEKAALALSHSGSIVDNNPSPVWTRTQAAAIGCHALELLSILTETTAIDITDVIFEKLKGIRAKKSDATVVELVETFIAALPVDAACICHGKRFPDRLKPYNTSDIST